MHNASFWSMEEPPVHPILRGRRNADAVVVGGGLSGLHISLCLLKAGLRVILLEANTLGSGSSSRCGGLVTLTSGLSFSHMDRVLGRDVCQAYVQTQTSALQAVRELAQEQGNDSGWRDMDAYIVAKGDRAAEALRRERDIMQQTGLSASFTQATQCPIPSDGAICLKEQAVMQPSDYMRFLTQKALDMGLQIFEQSRVIALETNLVYTQRGSVLAPYIVVATGYPVVNTPGWYFLRLIQRRSYLLPMGHSTGFDGIYLDAEERYTLRRHRDGSLFHLSGERVGTRVREQPLQRFSREYSPFFENAVPTQAYSGIDTQSADGLPYIGAYSKKTPNIFVATGYGQRGIVSSMVAAQAIAARVLGLPAEGYGIYLGQRRGGGVLRANIKTTAGIAGRYLKGMFRLHAPRCPHLGCKLVYRPKTRCWECPCHGSRFDDIGRVINAPAVHDAPIHHHQKP